MTVGQHVFGPNRVGLWVIPNSGLTDKLRHIMPRARGPLPNLTDIFLPPSATLADKQVVRDNGFFAHTYDVAHAVPAVELAKKMKADRARLGTGAIEVDLEGAAVQPDKPALANYATAFVGEIRRTNPNLPVRLNVPPYKGYALPVELINEDPQLFVIAQAYFGNQDGRLSDADVLEDLLDWGIDRAKVKIMYGVLNDNWPQRVRVFTLPNPDFKPITQGSVFSDDLLLDAGAIL